MSVMCPHCGKSFTIQGNGRPRKQVPVQKVMDALRVTGNIDDTLKRLNIGRGTLYRLLKPLGVSPAKIARGE